MKEKLNQIRAKSENMPSMQRKIVNVLFVLLLGAVLGFLAKYTDGSAIGLIGTYLGFWILVTTIIVGWSRSPEAAALHAFVFLAAMLLVYYWYSMILFGFFPKTYFIAWGSIALLSPIGGYFVWYARGKGWIAAFCAALPISLLVVEGYRLFYIFSDGTIGLLMEEVYDFSTFIMPQVFDIFAAIVLFLLLPREHIQRLRILPIVIVLVIFVRRFGLFYFLP